MKFEKIDLLAIGAHPDDVELSACGTLLAEAAKGRTFGLLDLTQGELGTRGSAALRKIEGERSRQILGARFRETLDLGDGRFEWNDANLRQIIRVIRRWRPEIVLINAPEDRHPDHGRSAKIEADACFFSGLEKIETFEDDGSRQEKWRPRAVYHYIQDEYLKPDFVVDVTPFWGKKMEAILAFSSQFFAENEDESMPKTPISGPDFLKLVESKARIAGRSAGFELAEGFIAARAPGVRSLFDLV